MTNKHAHGRPSTGRNIPLCIKVSPAAMARLQGRNKSATVDEAIKAHVPEEDGQTPAGETKTQEPCPE